MASTSVSVASNTTDNNASGAMDADTLSTTHDATTSIATDSASSAIAVGATTVGLPPRSSHLTFNHQSHK